MAPTPASTRSPHASQRVTLIAAGSVFCALFALALATLPAHRRPDAVAPGSITAADDAAQFAQVGDAAAIAPPASITRDAPRHPASVGALPQLGQRPAPASTSGSSEAPSGSGPPGGGGAALPGSTATTGGPAPSITGPASAPSSGLPDPAQVAQSVFTAINASRRNAGLRALKWSSGLQTSAQQHNQAMANTNTLSHQVSGEADLGKRESAAGVFWWWAGENIAMSSSLTAQAALDLESAMVNEQAPNDGHRKNILAGNAQAVGVAVLFDSAHHRLWLTEDFAQTSLL
ncbi:MAG TPA: CAP domain-containing protein [Jatrophihabitantaceae bacterium]